MRSIRFVLLATFASTIISAPSVLAQTGAPKLEIGTRQGDYYWVVETSPDGSRRGGWVNVAIPLNAIDRSALKPLPPAAPSAAETSVQAPPPPAASSLDERLTRIEQALSAKQGTTQVQVQELPAVRSTALSQISQPRPQTFEPAGPRQTKGGVVGVFGTTFVSTEVAPIFGAEWEGRANQNIGFYGSFGRMQNGAPTSLQDEVDLFSLLVGVPFTVKIPTTYFTGGVRFIAPTSSGIDVYGLVGTGLAHIKADISAVGVTLPTSALEDLTGEQLSATKSMFEFGGGIGIPVSRLRIDLGYRFGRPFDTGDEPINWSRFQAGVGVWF